MTCRGKPDPGAAPTGKGKPEHDHILKQSRLAQPAMGRGEKKKESNPTRKTEGYAGAGLQRDDRGEMVLQKSKGKGADPKKSAILSRKKPSIEENPASEKGRVKDQMGWGCKRLHEEGGGGTYWQRGKPNQRRCRPCGQSGGRDGGGQMGGKRSSKTLGKAPKESASNRDAAIEPPRLRGVTQREGPVNVFLRQYRLLDSNSHCQEGGEQVFGL